MAENEGALTSAAVSNVAEQVLPLLDYQQKVYRLVESQAYAATSSLVDNHDEQALLEGLLDEVKPPYKAGTQSLHYLISTPFRYPPLQYGSRFGDRTMASYFYASESQQTVLVESAYYRFAFMAAMEKPYQDPIRSQHMLFSVDVDSKAMADLTTITDSHIQAQLRATQGYGFTQSLGRVLTTNFGAKVMRYFTARASEGVNVAIAQATEIGSKAPVDCVNWYCHTTTEHISFSTRGQSIVAFDKALFCVDGRFVMPA